MKRFLVALFAGAVEGYLEPGNCVILVDEVR